MRQRTAGSITFDIMNYTLLLLMAAMTLIPFLYIISGSLATSQELLVKKFLLVPTTITFDAYKYIFSSKTIYTSLMVSVFITVIGTLINIVLTSLMAYPLSRPNLPGRKHFMLMVVFVMVFNSGMIPMYIVVRSLGLINSYWALWLPGAISAFNLILLKNFFQQLPEGIEESAKMDGCNDVQTLFKIVLPLSMPAIATFSLFYAVGHWNSYFNSILYINDMHKWPVQVWLRQIVILSAGGFTDSDNASELVIPPETIKYAVIVTATFPILLVYPFLQKHFAKGVLLGSVKG